MFFNKNKVLSHAHKINPYGLYDDYGYPLSRKETIDFFQKIDLTDQELDILNQYIKKSRTHSFYDNFFLVYDENGHEVDYITGLRSHQEMVKDFESKNFSFICTESNHEWNVDIKGIENFNGYIRCHIICNGNDFYTYMGLTDQELWICFPHIDKATILSTFEDTFWNTDELYRLLKNKTDAISIAFAVKKLEHFFNTFNILKDDILF